MMSCIWDIIIVLYTFTVSVVPLIESRCEVPLIESRCEVVPLIESRCEESYYCRWGKQNTLGGAKDTLDCVIVYTCRIPVIHPRYEESYHYRCTKATLDGVIVYTCRIVPLIESRCEDWMGLGTSKSVPRSSSVPIDTKDRNSCGWFNFPIVSTLRLKTLTDGMRHKIWAHHSRVKRETKDTVNNTYTDSSGYNLYECLCSLHLFAICSITMAILLLTAIAMLTISILVLTGLQTISELITIWRKVNKFIKKLCQPRCENSSSAAEKQVVQALRTACKRQTFNIASKKQLGLEFLEAFSGSIIIRFITEMGNSLQKIKDACATGKIREFLPNIFMGTGVESKLGEGDVMWRYFLYKESWRSSGINVDTARAAATEIQEDILNPIKLHWNLFVEELDPRKLYADLKSKGLLGDQDGIEMLKHVSRKDRTVFLLERLNALKEPGLGYKILLDHCSENEYIRHKIMEKEELQANSKHQEKSTSTGCMSDQKLMFSATILLSVHRKASTIGMKKNTGPECDNEFEITCLDVLDPVCYFDNTVEDMGGDDDLQEIFMKLEQVQEPEEEKIVLKTIEDMGGDDDIQEIFMKLEQPEEEKIILKTRQPCLKRKRNVQIDA